MKTLIYFVMTVFVSASSAADLSSAIGAALKEAEQNHQAQQVALEVNTDQIEQAKFHREQNPKIIEMNASPEVDHAVFSTKDEADEIEVEDSLDISQEVNDK